jgi:hypothetical protein
MDFLDNVMYRVDRHTRHILYFWESGSDILSTFLWYAIGAATCLRLFLIFIGGGWMIRELLVRLGLSDTISQHQEWFKAANDGNAVSFGVDEALRNLVDQKISKVGVVILLVLLYGTYRFLNQILEQQRARFDEDWKGSGREENLGGCVDIWECPCASSKHIPALSEDPAARLWWAPKEKSAQSAQPGQLGQPRRRADSPCPRIPTNKGS